MCFSNNRQLKVQLFFMDHLNHRLLSHIFPPISLMIFHTTINRQTSWAGKKSQESKTSARGAKFAILKQSNKEIDWFWSGCWVQLNESSVGDKICIFSSCLVSLPSQFAGLEVVWLHDCHTSPLEMFHHHHQSHQPRIHFNMHLYDRCSSRWCHKNPAQREALVHTIDTINVSNCTRAGFSWFCATYGVAVNHRW